MLKERYAGNITFSLIFMILVSFLLVAVYGHYKSTSEVMHSTQHTTSLTSTLESISEVSRQTVADSLLQKEYNFSWDGYTWVTTSSLLDTQDISTLENQLETVIPTELGLSDQLSVNLSIYAPDCTSPVQPLSFVNPYVTSTCVQTTTVYSGITLTSYHKLEGIVFDFNPSAVIGVISVGVHESLSHSLTY